MDSVTTYRQGYILWPFLSWTLFVVGVTYCVAAVLGWGVLGGCGGPVIMCDGAAYYYADLAHPYDWTGLGAGVQEFRYAPAFLWAIAPLQLLPFEGFAVVWFGLHVAAFVWLRAGWMIAIPGLNEDVIRGNISVFLAVAVVLALRGHAWTWATVLLTKVTPGVAVIWHAARYEWSALAVALGSTLAVIAVGALLAPSLWLAWLDALRVGPATYEVGHPLGPLALRLVLVAGLTMYAARTERAWLVPVAMIVAVPGLWPGSFALLAAIPRLRTNPGDPAPRL